jgi:hypothetical protein
MQQDDYLEIVMKLGQSMDFFENLETVLFGHAKEQTETGIYVRFVQAYIALVAFRLKQEFENRFEDAGGWSLTE